MEWKLIGEFLGIFCTVMGAIWVMMKIMLKDIHGDLVLIKSDISNIKNDIKELKEEQKDSRKRSDHLYEICIEMLRTRHKG